MTNAIEQITKQEETRSKQIARVVSQLPETEQEKIYYLIKGVELAGVTNSKSANCSAV